MRSMSVRVQKTTQGVLLSDEGGRFVVNSMEENRFIEGEITSDDYMWLGMILHSGLDASYLGIVKWRGTYL